MKKLLLAIAFISFVGLTYANPGEDGKKSDKKEQTNKKGNKKECTADAKKSCTSKDGVAAKSCSTASGKSCCASKAKTEEKKGE